MQDVYNLLLSVWNGLFMRSFVLFGFTMSFGQLLIFLLFVGLAFWFIGRLVS